MTASSDEFVEFIKEQLCSLPKLSNGRFFGGTGFASEGVQFAMVMSGSIYFVVDDSTRVNYERMGSHSFSYKTKKGRVNVKKYFSVPAEIIEDQERLVGLAKESIASARASKRGPVHPVKKRRLK
jgi:DNA transformation protein